MANLLQASLRVTAGFFLSTLVGWGLGQALQDRLSEGISRPAVNDALHVSEFLAALPPAAHAGRLLSAGLGMMLGTWVVRRFSRNQPVEAWALTALYATGAVFDVFRVDHGPALSIATVAMVLPCAWMGMNLGSRGRS
ncbi:MAG: hypothetical protein ACPF8U_03150 [Flavobacteriales bacterium]